MLVAVLSCYFLNLLSRALRCASLSDDAAPKSVRGSEFTTKEVDVVLPAKDILLIASSASCCDAADEATSGSLRYLDEDDGGGGGGQTSLFAPQIAPDSNASL